MRTSIENTPHQRWRAPGGRRHRRLSRVTCGSVFKAFIALFEYYERNLEFNA